MCRIILPDLVLIRRCGESLRSEDDIGNCRVSIPLPLLGCLVVQRVRCIVQFVVTIFHLHFSDTFDSLNFPCTLSGIQSILVSFSLLFHEILEAANRGTRSLLCRNDFSSVTSGRSAYGSVSYLRLLSPDR